jgi:hypothetical protein
LIYGDDNGGGEEVDILYQGCLYHSRFSATAFALAELPHGGWRHKTAELIMQRGSRPIVLQQGRHSWSRRCLRTSDVGADSWEWHLTSPRLLHQRWRGVRCCLRRDWGGTGSTSKTRVIVFAPVAGPCRPNVAQLHIACTKMKL